MSSKSSAKTRNFLHYLLPIALFIFTVFRLPSLFEPYWYGDEGIYEAVGLALRHGRILYKNIWDNKPPFIYFLYAIFNSTQFWLKLASLVFGLLAVIVFFYFCKKLFYNLKDKYALLKIAIPTLCFALLFGLPILEGNIANAENFMILLNLIAALLVYHSTSLKLKRSMTVLFIAGLSLALSFLFKIVAIFDLAAFLFFLVVYFLTYGSKELLSNLIKKIGIFLLGFLIPLTLTGLYFFIKHDLSNMINAVFIANINYVGYLNGFLITQGLLFIKIFILLVFCFLLFIKRNSLTKEAIFIWSWMGFSTFNAFFSQRPYTHYLLVILPSFCLLLGMIFIRKNILRITSCILGITLIVMALKHFIIYDKTFGYYKNFLKFATHQETFKAYSSFFDPQTPVYYSLSNFVKTNTKPKDSIFVWGNNPVLYKLTNKVPPAKYTVYYYILSETDGLSSTKLDLEQKKPKLIIIMPHVPSYPLSLKNFKLKKTLDKVLIYERI